MPGNIPAPLSAPFFYTRFATFFLPALLLLTAPVIPARIIVNAEAAGSTAAGVSGISIPLSGRIIPRGPTRTTTSGNDSPDNDTPPALPASAIPSRPEQDKKAGNEVSAQEAVPRLGWDTVAADINAQLDTDQKTIETIFAKLRNTNPPPSGLILNQYNDQVSMIRKHTGNALSQIQVYDSAMTSIMQVLGDKPTQGEDPSVTAQRIAVGKVSRAIKTTMIRAKLYDLQARQLSIMIDTLRSHIEQVTLSKRSISPFLPMFWRHLFRENGSDLASLKRAGIHYTSLKNTTALLLPVGAAVILLLSAGLALLTDRLFMRLVRHNRNGHQDIGAKKPDSAINLLNGLFCGLMASGLWFIWEIILPLGDNILSGTVSDALPICGFILGSGLPLRQWRSGKSNRRGGIILIISLTAFSVIKTMQNQEIIGPSLNTLLECLFTLFVSISFYLTCLGHHHRCTLAAEAGTDQIGADRNMTSIVSAIERILYPVSILLLLVSLIAILCGYLSFAFVMTGQLVFFIYAFGMTGLLIGAWQQLTALVLSPRHQTGKRLVQIGLSSRRLEQASILCGALGCVMLVMVFLALLDINGDLSLSGLWKRLHRLFTGNNTHGAPFSPETILGCLLLVAGAHYVIALGRNWLNTRFFPTTRLNSGAQNSILSILTYSAWILVGLTILSMIGLSVQNLTWVVSALSVGVGFGLQSIVKDFISGIILLAERPIQNGDIIEIAGNRGEVRRVNVRATDITLADGSTLIVPNSQFITANVKNSSREGIPACLTLDFTLPATTDLEKARTLVMDAVSRQETILSAPAPQIRLTSLSGANINLSLDISFMQIRDEENIRNTLLLAIFERFHQEDISINMS